MLAVNAVHIKTFNVVRCSLKSKINNIIGSLEKVCLTIKLLLTFIFDFCLLVCSNNNKNVKYIAFKVM